MPIITLSFWHRAVRFIAGARDAWELALIQSARKVLNMILTRCYLFLSRMKKAFKRKFSGAFSTIDSSGVAICFKVWGEGPAVVLIHGYTSDALDWNHVIQLLQDRFRLIAIDCRGHGGSGKPEEPASYGRKMVGDVRAVLRHLGIEKACLVGYSMGAEIALRCSVEYPELVSGLVLGGSGWSGGNESKVYAEIGKSLKEHRSFGPFMQNSAVDLDLLDTDNFNIGIADGMLKGQNIDALAAVAQSMKEIINLSEQDISHIHIPVLAISGDLDDEKPNLEKMIGVVPDISCKLLPDKDHMEAFLDPEFCRLIEHYLVSNYLAGAQQY